MSAEKIGRPREGAAEGGYGGNSAAPERNQTEASPAALLVQSRATQKSSLFLLEEKIGARKSGKAKKTFLWGSAGFPHGGGAASLVPFKVGSREVYNYSTMKKLSKSLRKHIRKEKSRIRREFLDRKARKENLRLLYKSLNKWYKNKFLENIIIWEI